MEFIDPRTFLVTANLLGLLCAFVLWVESKSFPKDVSGLKHWATGVAAMGSGAGLISLRDYWHPAFSVVLANALSLFGAIALIVGLRRFAGKPGRWRPMLDAAAAATVLLIWLTFGTHSVGGAVFIVAGGYIILFSYGAWLAWNAQPKGFAAHFLTGAFLFGALVAASRLATLSMGVEQDIDLFEQSTIQRVYLGTFSLGVLGLAIGFILLANARLREALEYMATRDPMTGAFNRRAFYTRAELEWARAERSRAPLAVITSDIDFFKKVNDTYGHHIGDLVIKDFSNRATGLLRKPDILARFGGEEFVILLPDTGLAEARHVAERVRAEIETHRDQKLPKYTVSLGVSVAFGKTPSPKSTESVESLLSVADEALYRAKQGGRNRVES